MAYYSALYIPQDELKLITADDTESSKIQSSLIEALMAAKLSSKDYNLKDLSKDMTIMANSEITRRYVTSAVSKIIRGEAITSQTVLDTLFNTYAPAFNGMLEQMGYNSISQMKTAARSGNLNASNFLNGFSTTLSVLTETFSNDSEIEKYGEEIPIDVIEEFNSKYVSSVAEHPTLEGVDIRDYIKQWGKITLKLEAHVYNKTAEMWSIGDFLNKLQDAINLKKTVVFRIGRTIYENVIIKEFEPTITNIYDLNFRITLSYNHVGGRVSRHNATGYHIINGSFNQEVTNFLKQEEYLGEGKVEGVKLTETELIEGIKKTLGFDKVLVQGQYI